MIGRRLAHYEILEKVGSGGMGEVYRARDTRLDRDVALKLLPPALASDPDRAARFEREARAVAALRHPNIVTIHAVEEDQGLRFMAMELVEGRTLAQVVPPGGLSLERFLELAIPLADAIAAAHAKGITHRDLKPDNVMVEADGRVKVLDFGLAKSLQVGLAHDATVAAGPQATQEGHILGTVAYMSPEQAEGKPVDPRSDVFSLGIVLYEMITGDRPFQGATHISTLTAILRDTPLPVHERKRSVPRQLDRILQRCLEKSPDRRYETARGLRNDLESLRAEETSQPGRPVTAARPKRLAPWMAYGGLLVLLALLALGGGWYWSRGREASRAPAALPGPAATAKPRMIVVFPFENMGSADDQYFAAGISEEITSRLSALSGLGVLSRTSAVQYDRKGKTMQKIADELGVDYVLDGTVRWARSGAGGGASQVRITPQLILAREDRQVWSQSYDRSMDEIFRIQTDIASEVVDKLGMAVGGREREALTAAPTTNVEAYHLFLRAGELLNSISFSREDFDRAVALLEEACAKDAGFLRAHAELAKAHAGYIHFAWDPSQDRQARSEKAAERALRLDPDSGWSQLGLGYYHYWARKDYEKAYAAFSRAQAGLPSSSEAIEAMGLVRRRQGKFEEAVSDLQRATFLDPRNALDFFTLGETLAVLRRFDEAVSSLDRAIALAPDPTTAYTVKARVLLLAGDVAGARTALERSIERGAGSSENRVARFSTAIGLRDYGAALRYADALPEASNAQFGFECRPAARGWAKALAGDAAGASAEFARALPLLEAYVREHPDQANPRSALALVLAQLGRSEEALREGRAALALRPAATDAWLRQFRLLDLVVVEIVTGRHDDAVKHLGELLAQPSDQVSVPLLRLSPLFDPLRKHPGFLALP